jgi:hypothetical protein
VVAAIYARRSLGGIPAPRLAPGARVVAAALAGAAAAFLAMGIWIVLAAMPNSSDRDGPIEAFQRTGDERKIVACVMSGRNEQVLGSSAREDGNTVTVNVRLRRPPSWYFSDLVGIPLPVIVTLNEPLGSRTVVDVWSGVEVRELSRTEPSRFTSWC